MKRQKWHHGLILGRGKRYHFFPNYRYWSWSPGCVNQSEKFRLFDVEIKNSWRCTTAPAYEFMACMLICSTFYLYLNFVLSSPNSCYIYIYIYIYI